MRKEKYQYVVFFDTTCTLPFKNVMNMMFHVLICLRVSATALVPLQGIYLCVCTTFWWSAATRINQTTPLLARLSPQLLARLEARQCLKDIEARLFPGDGGPENGEQPTASPPRCSNTLSLT